MPLHLIKPAAETVDQHLDAAPPVRYRETESAIAAAQRQQRTYSAKQPEPAQHLWADALHTSVGPELAPAEELQSEPPRVPRQRKPLLSPAGWFWLVYGVACVAALVIPHLLRRSGT